LIADSDKGLKIINITDPKIPLLHGSIDTDGNAMNVCYYENDDNRYALIADGYKGLKIINITDPSSPVLQGSIISGGYAWDVSTFNNGGN
jgi:hypothetical protein